MYLDFRKSLFCLILLISFLQVDAQRRFIEVVSVDGDVKASDNNHIETGDKLSSSETITLGENSFVSFIDQSGNIYEYSSNKKIKLKTLINKDIRVEVPIDLLNSVKRISSPVLDGPDFYIIKPTPYSSTVTMKFDTTVRIEWFMEEWSKSKEFRLVLRDIFGKEIRKIETNDSHFDLNLREINDTKELIIEVSSKSSTQTLLLLDISADYTDYDGALNQLLIGLFLESKLRFELAEKYYKSASSSSSTYEKYYENFLVRFKKYGNPLSRKSSGGG